MFGVIPAFWQRRGTTPPIGDVTIYEGGHTVPQEVGGTALAQHDLFVARLDTFAMLAFDEEVSPGVPVYAPGDPVLGVGFARNGITMTMSCSSPSGIEEISADTTSGRFNTTPLSFADVVELFADNLKISSSAPITLNFSPNVAAFGFYATDIGDFGGVVKLRLTKNDATTIEYTMLIDVSTTNGNVYFWGIVDTTGTTYSKVEFISSDPGLDDFFGLDDIIYVDDTYILP